MPGPPAGYMRGRMHLDSSLSPAVPADAPRPFALAEQHFQMR